MPSIHDYSLLAEMCKSTYTWYPWRDREGVEVVEVEEGPMVFYLVKWPGNLACVIRGTDDIRDWIYNFRVSSKSTGGVHRGWFQLFQRIYPKVTEFYLDHYCPGEGCCLSLAGHSLGGAIATLIHREATHVHNIQLNKVCVFGSPAPYSHRRGLLEDKLPWSDNLVRFVNGNDIIPSVLNWRRNTHVGTEVQIGNPSWWRWRHMVTDHDMPQYLTSMNADLNRSIQLPRS